ncbi:hypothetical protein NS359_08085 [Curtobacterium oceanosedimentum]|uniref:Methyltransferase n=2 Tax=Curtobacterium oceanosedimentum TaxID=465820 RepID=A0A147DR19_9MICO|nr:hypothetical protein NS359_08085 [Curtobacterium oceanosedimentum]
MLKDYRRLLRPGGAIRVVSPDALLVADILANVKSERVAAQLDFDAKIHGWDRLDEKHRWRVANRMAYQFGQHHALLSASLMETLLIESGFVDVVKMDVRETRYFETVPTTHFERFPESHHEVFTVEARTPDVGLD